MQGDERLLLDTFDGHGGHLPGSDRLQDRLGICAVRFVATHVGPHVRRRDQRHPMTVRLRDPPQ